MNACLESRKWLESKGAKLENDLNCANATLKKMNIGTKALNEVLGIQKRDSDKVGLGYTGGASTSKAGCKMAFIKPIGNNFMSSKAHGGKTSLKNTTGARVSVLVMSNNKKRTSTTRQRSKLYF